MRYSISVKLFFFFILIGISPPFCLSFTFCLDFGIIIILDNRYLVKIIFRYHVTLPAMKPKGSNGKKKYFCNAYELVNHIPNHSGDNFVKYAQKLGYDKNTAELAVARLSPKSLTNELLKAVIDIHSEKSSSSSHDPRKVQRL